MVRGPRSWTKLTFREKVWYGCLVSALCFIHSLPLTTFAFIFVLLIFPSDSLWQDRLRTLIPNAFPLRRSGMSLESDRPAQAFLFWKSFTFWNDVKTNIICWNGTEKRLREEYAPKVFKEAPSTIWTRAEESFLTFLKPVLGSEVLVISWLSEPFKFARLLCGGIL